MVNQAPVEGNYSVNYPETLNYIVSPNGMAVTVALEGAILLPV